MKYFNRDVLFLHIAVMLFGLSGVVGRFVNLPATAVAGGRVIFSSVLLLLLCLVTRTGLKLGSRRDYLLAVFAGIMLAYSLYVAAQKRLKAQTVGIISGMETVYGIVYALLFLKEVPTLRELLGGAVILSVALVFSLGNQEEKAN